MTDSMTTTQSPMTAERRSPRHGPGVVWGPLAQAPALGVVGGLLTLLYTVMVGRTWLPRFFPEPGVTIDFKDMLGADWRWVSAQYIAAVVLAFVLFGVALTGILRGRKRVPMAVAFGFPVLFSLVLVWMYPPTAVDLFYYHASARVLWIHGENPFLVPPGNFPYPVAFSWSDRPSVYGPVWTYLTSGPVLLAGDHFTAGVLAFKALAALSYLGCALLVYRLVRRLRPGWETVAVVIFAWNPFVVLRTVGNGHNDLVMMFFVLLALERAEQRDWLVMFPSLIAAVMVKYIAALLGPLVLLYAWWQTPGTLWQRVRALAPGIVVAGLFTAMAYLPFWEGPRIFDEVRVHADGKIITSTLLLLETRLAAAVGPEEALPLARQITRLVFLALYLPLVWQCRRDFARLLACSFNAFFFYLLVAGGWFRPWYLLWPITVAALAPQSWLMVVALALAFAGSFPDLVEQYRLNIGWLRDYWRATAAPVMLWVWPALLAWYYGLLRFRTWHFDVPGRISLHRADP